MPRVRGGLDIPISKVTALYEYDQPIFHLQSIESTEVENRIGEAVASIVQDGDTIQLGIGGMPNAVARSLSDKKDLGLHTEMYTTEIGRLIRNGVITGERKNFCKGTHVGCFVSGDEALFDTVSKNPNCRVYPGSWAVNPKTIMQNENMVSINTIVEMDLTGQVCAESIGPRQLSGPGGSFCFCYGALHSKGGRAILAFSSTTNKGVSRIAPMLKQGAVVTIPRTYVDVIVTEYGIAYMRGRSLKQRVESLISIAHPDFRADLRKEAKNLNYII